jgi:hypothetical protein
MTLGKLISGLITRPSERRLAKLGHAAPVIAAWRDNVFIKRQWRTIKNEERYLRANTSLSEARAGIGRYLGFYGSRHHSSLGGKTPGTRSDQPNHLSLRLRTLTLPRGRAGRCG